MPLQSSLQTLSTQGAPFVKELLRNLVYDGFEFPDTGSEGVLGSTCISKSLRVEVGAKKKQVAFHLIFECTPGQYVASGGGSVNLAISGFHLTARPAGKQDTINEAGASILTSAESVHIGPGGVWGRSQNLAAFAAAMELKDTAEALAVLAGPAYLAKTTGVTQERKDALKGTWTEGYTGTYMTIAARELRAKIIQRVVLNTGLATVTFENSDVTFPNVTPGATG